MSSSWQEKKENIKIVHINVDPSGRHSADLLSDDRIEVVDALEDISIEDSAIKSVRFNEQSEGVAIFLSKPVECIVDVVSGPDGRKQSVACTLKRTERE